MEPMAGDHGRMAKRPVFPSKLEPRQKARRKHTDGPSADAEIERDLYLGPWLARLELDQVDVASKSGVKKSYLSQLVSGKKSNPSALKMLVISEAMGMTVNDLYRPPPPRTVVDGAQKLSAIEIIAIGKVADMLKASEQKK